MGQYLWWTILPVTQISCINSFHQKQQYLTESEQYNQLKPELSSLSMLTFEDLCKIYQLDHQLIGFTMLCHYHTTASTMLYANVASGAEIRY